MNTDFLETCNFYDSETQSDCQETGKYWDDCSGRRLCSQHREKFLKIRQMYLAEILPYQN